MRLNVFFFLAGNLVNSFTQSQGKCNAYLGYRLRSPVKTELQTHRVYLRRYGLESSSMIVGLLDLVLHLRLCHGLFLHEWSTIADRHRPHSNVLPVVFA